MANPTIPSGADAYTVLTSLNFTPDPTDDWIRTLNKYEIAIQKALFTGDVTHDPVAKATALQGGVTVSPPVSSPAPAPSVLVVSATTPSSSFVTGDAVNFKPVSVTSGASGTLLYTVTPELTHGLTLNTATGYINGTAAGTMAQTTYTMTVEDSAGQDSSATFTVTITATAPAPAPTPAPSPAPSPAPAPSGS